MNLFERTLAAVAPRTALRRLAAQQQLQMLRSYDAASRGRRQDSWVTPGSSAAGEVSLAGAKVRYAVRDLLRNNGYAQRAHRTLVRATVGTGIVGTPMLDGGKIASRKARDAWTAFVDGCAFDGHHDLYGLQLLAARTMFESGEALVRFYRQSFDASTRIAPVRIQILEPDHIDTSKYLLLNNDAGYIDRGIEYDAQGRKTALWLLPDHPGNLTPYIRGRFQSERVPVGEVEQVYDMLRPGQDRGVSIFAGAVMPLKDLADYCEAETMRKRIEACLAVFVTSPEGDGPQLGLPNGKDVKTGAPITRITPGMVSSLRPGEGVTTLVPSGNGDISPLVTQLQFLAAAAGGVMFEHMTGNFEHVNYSSYRVGSFDFAGTIEQLQWLVLAPRMNRPIAARFLEAARAANLLAGGDVAIRWTPPSAVTSPDPFKDAQADQLNMRNGTVARSELNERRGWSDAELLERYREDLAASDAIGVQFDGDPRKNLKAPTQTGDSTATTTA